MAIEVSSSGTICRKCGKAYGRNKGYFPVNYGVLYKGVGYLPYCRECVDAMYSDYLSECKQPKLAVRQMCRKLDIYWNDSVYEAVEKQNAPRSMMTQYLAKIASIKTAGKCYDDTLREEGVFWDEPRLRSMSRSASDDDYVRDDDIEISDDIKALWGPGYTPEMYMELEQRKNYWVSRLPEGVDFDIGTEAIIKQICSLEIDINRDRAAGKSVDRNINTLNTLLGSASLKPTQKRDSEDAYLEKTPMGVWIKKWENYRPIPDPDPDMQDVDGIIRYIEVWFKGHIAKMLNKKTASSKMYEEKMNELRVDNPEFEDEDDETVFNEVFGENNST